jgi:transcriptional regulatory protein LevR/transcriptional regulator with AAA-type ATPase domain
MKRIDIVLNKLIELSKGKGIDASTLGDIIGLTRANVSSDLNKLCAEKKIKKGNGRPVLFYPMNEDIYVESDTNCLDIFAKENLSLITAVEQAKAAILYPPNGMHSLILGDTGVGKSMFVSLMHKYAMEMKKLKKDAPFIVFNCADYANNPQLLIGQLFGVKKGAYTGADTDKVGLLEKANEGILFLDEVHRLPAEGQEMFFTYMDKYTFQRIGETEVGRKVKVLIISATTENPESNLLKTFTRRIPMIIKIPNLNERTVEERFNLVPKFFIEESARLDKEIFVSQNSMKALISYHCENNVGQLKNDVQLVCAKAYADFLSRKKDSIKINSSDLVSHVKEGLIKSKDLSQIWSKLLWKNNLGDRYCIFDAKKNSFVLKVEEDRENIYEVMDKKANELKDKGLKDEEIEKVMEQSINGFFNKYINSIGYNESKLNLANLVEPSILTLVDEIIKYAEGSLNKIFSAKIYYGLALHISTTLNRLRENKKIVNPQLNKIRTEYREEFLTALNCIKIIEKKTELTLPLDEAGFMAMFFAMDDAKELKEGSKVKIIVVTHGNSTASSMCDVANKILGTEYAVGFNLHLDMSINEMIDRIKNFIKHDMNLKGYLLLVDMGSLTTLREILDEEFHLPVKVISNVSTLYVLEATRKALIGCSLLEIHNDMLRIPTLTGGELEEVVLEEPRRKAIILTVCITGEGSAIAIKSFIQSNLTLDERLFEILTMNIIGTENIESRICKLQQKQDILCVVSSFNLNIKIPQFHLENILSLKGIKDLQEIVDVQNTYYKMGQTFKDHLKNIDTEHAFRDIRNFIVEIEKFLGIKVEVADSIGIALHIGCMLDRVKEENIIIKYPHKEDFKRTNQKLFNYVKKTLEVHMKEYEVDINDDEVCVITNFFKAK